jgi:hypothetical protein
MPWDNLSIGRLRFDEQAAFLEVRRYFRSEDHTHRTDYGVGLRLNRYPMKVCQPSGRGPLVVIDKCKEFCACDGNRSVARPRDSTDRLCEVGDRQFGRKFLDDGPGRPGRIIVDHEYFEWWRASLLAKRAQQLPKACRPPMRRYADGNFSHG